MNYLCACLLCWNEEPSYEEIIMQTISYFFLESSCQARIIPHIPKLVVTRPWLFLSIAHLGIGLLGRHNSITTDEIIESDVLAAMNGLIGSMKHANQLAGLQVVAGLALASDSAARRLLSPELLQNLMVRVFLMVK